LAFDNIISSNLTTSFTEGMMAIYLSAIFLAIVFLLVIHFEPPKKTEEGFACFSANPAKHWQLPWRTDDPRRIIKDPVAGCLVGGTR